MLKQITLTMLLVLVLASAAPGVVGANSYPVKTVTIIVPVPAGGGTDLFARSFAQGMAKTSGRNVVVDNRSGADGTIAANMVATASADGYTLFYSAASIATHNTLHPNLPYDVVNDFSPVARPVVIPFVLVIHPSLPAHNVEQLLRLARAKPGALNFGASGAGSAGRLSMELLKITTNTNIVYVPYRGAAHVTTALVSGEVGISFIVTPLVRSYIDGGKLRALAVTSSKRALILPDVPTVSESGVPGFEAVQWHGMFAPKNTPGSVIKWLHTDMQRTLAEPQMKKRFAIEGGEPVDESTQEFSQFFRAEVAKWREIVRRTGIKS